MKHVLCMPNSCVSNVRACLQVDPLQVDQDNAPDPLKCQIEVLSTDMDPASTEQSSACDAGGCVDHVTDRGRLVGGRMCNRCNGHRTRKLCRSCKDHSIAQSTELAVVVGLFIVFGFFITVDQLFLYLPSLSIVCKSLCVCVCVRVCECMCACIFLYRSWASDPCATGPIQPWLG